MPVYKDKKYGTWYTAFYYIDWKGEKKKKWKRGFSTKKEAQEYEREFLLKETQNIDMTFGSLVELYLEDMASRLRVTTMENKKYTINLKILPYFKNLQISKIQPTQIRKWQNEIISGGYSETYNKSINNQLVAIFNYAVKYYNLSVNPCHKAGGMGKKKADKMDFWTLEEFNAFIPCMSNKPQAEIAFNVLYYTGMRIGEMFALKGVDIHTEAKTLDIHKSLQRIKGEDHITKPKTSRSFRTITIPDSLIEDIVKYKSMLFDYKDSDRLFYCTKSFLGHEMERGCKESGVKKIRLHDLRHSHAALLIKMGYPPLLIAERLGHENVETTMNTYGHLYPNAHAEVAENLNGLRISSKLVAQPKKDP